MIGDVVVAALRGEALADALAAIHRSGLGHTARVMRAARGDLRGQLRRAGIPVESGPERLASEESLLTVAAAGRSPQAAALLIRSGAQATWIVSPSGFWREVDDAVMPPSVRGEPLPADTVTPPLDSPPAPVADPAAEGTAPPS